MNYPARLAFVAALSVPALAATGSAGDAAWKYSNNGKGNHYVIGLAPPYAVTFACKGQKVIAFFSAPAAAVDDKFKHAKLAYSIARVDADEAGNGGYAWFSSSVDVDDEDVTFNLNSVPQIVKLMQDISRAEKEVAFAATLDNPAKGRFATQHAVTFDVEGAGAAFPQIFEACGLR